MSCVEKPKEGNALTAANGGSTAQLPLGSTEFKKWFGKSKIVDENGNLLIVFHGTYAVFDSFERGYKDIGIHFGNHEQAIKRIDQLSPYRLVDKSKSKVMPVYLKMENPLVINDDIGQWHWISAMQKCIWREAEINPDDVGLQSLYLRFNEYQKQRTVEMQVDIDKWNENNKGKKSDRSDMDWTMEEGYYVVSHEWGDKNAKDAMKVILSAGYDGIKYLNNSEGDGWSYAVFSPNQIKSINNKGTWNAESENIYQ